MSQRYGPPEVVHVVDDAPMPWVGPDDVLVRVHATTVNRTDCGYRGASPFFIRGVSGVRRPRFEIWGTEYAGVVERVGREVTRFTPGDEVFGTGTGSWAELACAREPRLAPKPPGVSFADAAAVPIAGCTALQALRDHGRVEPGQKVLINGTSGGVGTYAVQLAKSFGADVTAVCSTRNVELVRSLGADRVVDYAHEDFTRIAERHDLLLDVAGSRSLGALGRILGRDATVVVVGGRMTYRRLGPLPHIVATLVMSKLRRRAVRFFVAKIERDDLAYLGSLLESRTIRSVIDRTYPLEQAPDALAYLGEGHARGKIVVTV